MLRNVAGKRGLTVERHREIGARLKAIRDELVALQIEIGHAYAIRHAVVMLAATASKGIDRLRAELEGRGFAEHGDAFSARIYYPPEGT